MGIGGCAFGQSFSLNDLIDYTAYTPSKFENSVGKRGYRSTAYGNIADGVSYTWHNKKIDTVQKSIFKCNKEGRATIAFQTTAVKEFEALRQQLNRRRVPLHTRCQNRTVSKRCHYHTAVTTQRKR
jgi:hypothetical protein